MTVYEKHYEQMPLVNNHNNRISFSWIKNGAGGGGRGTRREKLSFWRGKPAQTKIVITLT